MSVACGRVFGALIAAAFLGLLACSAARQPAPSPAPPPASPASSVASAPAPAHVDRVQIREVNPDGEVLLQAAVFWPVGARPDEPRPAIVWSHGSPITPAERVTMTPFGYARAVQWFVDRGYVVVAALRRGFGASEGHFSEGVDRDHFDYARAGRVAGHDIHAALGCAVALRGIDPTRIVLAGHSAGGFGSLALISESVHVRGAINFAGGKGAQLLSAGAPYTTALVSAAGEYGKTARVPSIWIYAENDKWFAPPLVTQMFDAYRADGAPAEIVQLPALGTDGHNLFTPEAQERWTRAVEQFLARVGMRAG